MPALPFVAPGDWTSTGLSIKERGRQAADDGKSHRREARRETAFFVVTLGPLRAFSGCKRFSAKLFVGWVQPTNSPRKAVGCTHPTIVKQSFPDSLLINLGHGDAEATMVADPGKFRWAPARRLESQGLRMVFQRFTLGGKMLSPADLGEISPPEGLAGQGNQSAGLVLSGKGPLWLYAHLVGLARSQGWPWVAVYDTRYCGGVVVSRVGAVAAAPGLGAIVPCQPLPDLEVDEPGDDPLPGAPTTTIHLTWTEGPRATWTLRLAAPGSGRGFDPCRGAQGSIQIRQFLVTAREMQYDQEVSGSLQAY